MPAGGTFEPTAAAQREAPAVSLALKAGFRNDGIVTDHFEIEVRTQDLRREAQLHQRGLEQDAPTLQFWEQVGGIFPAHVDGGVPDVAAFEARQDA
jgi:hypothetical protein